MAGRCSLCGSRLNNGKCEFCGLDNRMYDRNYLKDPYHLAEIAREADTPKAPPGQNRQLHPPGPAALHRKQYSPQNLRRGKEQIFPPAVRNRMSPPGRRGKVPERQDPVQSL